MPRKKVIVSICGGLGNQMFQYAAGRALALQFGVPLQLDVGWFESFGEDTTPRKFQLLNFPFLMPLVTTTASESWRVRLTKRIKSRLLHFSCAAHKIFPSIVLEPNFSYWAGDRKITTSVFLYGYWQSEKYFAPNASQIRKDFTFSPLPEGEVQAVATRIQACRDAVSVHIRRGDYISNPQAHAFHGLLRPNWYRVALEHMRKVVGNTTIFLFSDDPQWVRENFDPCGHDCEVVESNQLDAPQHDMHLMSLCQHHILANSSFSWWGAWLGQHDGIVVAPKKWFAKKHFSEYEEIYCNKWIIL